MRRPIRIGNFSGYLGDRAEALAEVLAGDPVDVLTGDYLAEVTLAPLAGRFRGDQSRGYVEAFVTQVTPQLEVIAERGLRLVTNAGGFNPPGLATVLREAAAGTGLRVASVAGDNVLAQLLGWQSAGHPLTHLDTGEPLASWGREPLAANAYLGGWGIAAALAHGADIVVCGRVTDASLALGPAAWWHGWGPRDWDALAGAVVAGHVIECGPHATGGNFSGFAAIPGIDHPGFPIAEIAADGSSVITKHGRDGGAVTVDTVTAQLVYEIQGPRYLNPDVTVHLETVDVAPDGPDRIRLSGVQGSPPPPTAKVAVFAASGFQTVQTVFVTAPDVEAKVALLERQIRAMADPGIRELTVTQLGTAAEDPATQWDATVAVRIMAVADTPEPLEPERFGDRILSLYLASVPGFFHDLAAARARRAQPQIEYWPALVPAGLVPHCVTLDDGQLRTIAPPEESAATGQPVHPEPPGGQPTGPTVRRPLGDLVFARCGDKGGNSNVGVWVRDPRAWPWLRATLTTDLLRGLLPEVRGLAIERHELPKLHAVHFVVRGLLGHGGSSNLRVDQVGKAVGEYLRAKHIDVPVELVTP